MKKLRYTVLIMLVTTSYAIAQSKKDLRKYKVKSVTEILTKNKNGKEETFKDAYARFNSNGGVVEEIEYTSTGNIKKKEVYTYNKSNDVTEHLYMVPKDTIYERSTYEYDKFGNKTAENVYNEKGALVKRSVYTYNNKGLKIEKKTFDNKGQIISVRKYQYEM